MSTYRSTLNHLNLLSFSVVTSEFAEGAKSGVYVGIILIQDVQETSLPDESFCLITPN